MILGFEISERELKIILGIIAETDPHLDIVEDIEMYLSGLSNKLSSKTINLLIKQKEQIKLVVQNIRDSENEK